MDRTEKVALAITVLSVGVGVIKLMDSREREAQLRAMQTLMAAKAQMLDAETHEERLELAKFWNVVLDEI